ncbi:MAG: hypothetical protein WDN76_08470 [Alphaproteobacteria bacterium]
MPTSCDGIACPANGSIGGETLPRESQYQATASLRYDGTLAIASGLDYYLGADASYKSKQYVDPLNMTWVPDRFLVNLNAGVTRGRVSLVAYVHNLLDEKYASASTYSLSPTSNIRYNVMLGERQTIGATLRYKF